MSTSDPTAILLAQNRWATQSVIDACAALSPEQFHETFEIGCGSLHDTITHILAAFRGWGDMIAEREQRPRLDAGDERRTTGELSALLAEIADDFAATVAAHPHDEEVTGSRGSRTFTFARGVVLTHVMTHGVHHRAQCLNMLRRLGVEPLPPTSVLEWVMMVGA